MHDLLLFTRQSTYPHLSKQIQAFVIHYLLREMWWHGFFSSEFERARQLCCWRGLSWPTQVSWLLPEWVPMALNLLLFCKLTMVTIICLHVFVTHIFSPIPTANSMRAAILSCPFICNFTIWVPCIACDSSQDKASIPPAAEIAARCQAPAKSLFWNFPQLSKDFGSSIFIQRLTSVSIQRPGFTASVQENLLLLTLNLCAISKSLVADCITAQLLFCQAWLPPLPQRYCSWEPSSMNLLYTSLHLQLCFPEKQT